jgi:hypothetical protein
MTTTKRQIRHILCTLGEHRPRAQAECVRSGVERGARESPYRLASRRESLETYTMGLVPGLILTTLTHAFVLAALQGALPASPTDASPVASAEITPTTK